MMRALHAVRRRLGGGLRSFGRALVPVLLAVAAVGSNPAFAQDVFSVNTSGGTGPADEFASGGTGGMLQGLTGLMNHPEVQLWIRQQEEQKQRQTFCVEEEHTKGSVPFVPCVSYRPCKIGVNCPGGVYVGPGGELRVPWDGAPRQPRNAASTPRSTPPLNAAVEKAARPDPGRLPPALMQSFFDCRDAIDGAADALAEIPAAVRSCGRNHAESARNPQFKLTADCWSALGRAVGDMVEGVRYGAALERLGANPDADPRIEGFFDSAHLADLEGGACMEDAAQSPEAGTPAAGAPDDVPEDPLKGAVVAEGPGGVRKIIDSPHYPPRLRRMLGLVQGFELCAQGVLAGGTNLMVAAQQMLAGHFIAARGTLGLVPGESITLKMIFQQATAETVGADPFQAGIRQAQRLCAFGVAPAAVKLGGKALSAATKGPGSLLTRLQRVKQTFFPREVTAFGTAPSDPVPPEMVSKFNGDLAGRWISLGRTAIKLGKKLGGGTFGKVYQIAGRRDIVAKIIRGDESGIRSVGGQSEGTGILKKLGIPVPEIRARNIDPRKGPIYLVLDDVTSKFGARTFGDLDVPSPEELSAMKRLTTRLAADGYIGEDLKPANLFTYRAGNGQIEAGVLDADRIFRPSELEKMSEGAQMSVWAKLRAVGRANLILHLDDANAPAIQSALDATNLRVPG